MVYPGRQTLQPGPLPARPTIRELPRLAKESDRVAALCTELTDWCARGRTPMADIHPCGDLHPAQIRTYQDHRMAMLFQ